MVLSTFTVTNLSDSGNGSLRAEIKLANENLGADVIIFKKGLSGPIGLDSGNELLIKDDLTINGPGASVIAVSGEDFCRVFEIAKGTDVSISGLTIENGSVFGDDIGGGGIFNQGTLTIANSIITGNFSGGESPRLGGAGILNEGTLTITNSTISGNSCSNTQGNGILNNGELTISDGTQITGNSGNGGATLVSRGRSNDYGQHDQRGQVCRRHHFSRV